ncbi:LysR family transcriptional regulator [Konateibacter massiliensis]|uniref:LysR family transcriptional regulator n=1 Tax=Konateibacter massiliensis TaxID=2002841 RepID=UPI000C15931B|nr:LysR family transcriptional regulator [Konateibacter massiliensis]
MEINYIKEFVILAETENFLEAADSLFISQSSLSKHIKSMEAELGTQLFDRTTRKVQLNESGRTFLEYAKQIANLQYRYTTALYNKTAHIKENINIGSIPIMASYHITDIILKFIRENKKFSVNLIEGESSQLKDMLRQNKCELAFIRDMDDYDNEFIHIPYTTDHLAAVLPEYHPLSKEPYLHLEQLKDENFLLLQPGSVLYKICTQACEQAGFTPNISFTGKRAENIVDLVEKGLGISLLMKKPIHYLSDSKVSIIDINPEITSQVNIYYKKNITLSTAAKHFIDCIQLPCL